MSDSDLQLGEVKFSYGYGGTAKVPTRKWKLIGYGMDIYGAQSPHVSVCCTCLSANLLNCCYIQVSENLQFRNYGVRFGEGDVIGCYLDLNTDQVTINVIVIFLLLLLFVPL